MVFYTFERVFKKTGKRKQSRPDYKKIQLYRSQIRSHICPCLG